MRTLPQLSPRPRVLLVCYRLWYTLLPMPALLARAGCEVTLVCPPWHPAMGSRHIRRTCFYDGDAEAGVAAARALIAARPFTRVIWTDEDMLRVVLERRADPALAATLPCARTAAAEAVLAGKPGLAHYGPAAGVPVPRGAQCHEIGEAVAFFEAQGRKPVILKPGTNSGGYCIEVTASAGRIAEWARGQHRPFVVQEFLLGRVGITEMVLLQGRPIAWVASYKTAYEGSLFGPSTARCLCRPAGMEASIAALGKLTGFTGFCGFDWLQEKDPERIRVLEFHARPTVGFAFGRQWGVDFVRAARSVIQQEPEGEPQAPPPSHLGNRACIFPGEIVRCVKTRRLRDLGNWLARDGPLRFAPWRDPGLIATTAVYFFRRLMRRAIAFIAPARGAKPFIF